MIRAAWLALAIVLHWLPAAAAACPPEGEPFPRFYRSAEPFRAATAGVQMLEPLVPAPTGLTVPHHLTADHLVASGMRLAAHARPRRIVLLFPDHFFATDRAVATTGSGFDTVLGPIPGDPDGAAALLATGLDAERSCLFGADHGVRALLPFLRHYFPDVPVLPVAISIRSRRPDWDALATALDPLVDGRTLVLQSTDFSHYLPHHAARKRDQETLNLLADGGLDGLASITQPGHADSAGALYVQTALQRRMGARPTVLFNENMQQYRAAPVAETTSYMVIAYGPETLPAPDLPGSRIVYLGGDTLFGRAITDLLLDEDAATRIETAVHAATGGRPLIVNLEGVLLPDVPTGLAHMTLAMPAALALEWLDRLNVVAVGLANNHSHDLGESGYAETRRALEAARMPHFGQGELVETEGITIAGLTDFGTNGSGDVALVTPSLLASLGKAGAEKPLVAFIHWGREYEARPGAREAALTEALMRAGASLIVGAHPHVASRALEALAGGAGLRLYSLGNFLFDQTAERASGALLELRLFDQGTYFARLRPLPNLFDLGRR